MRDMSSTITQQLWSQWQQLSFFGAKSKQERDADMTRPPPGYFRARLQLKQNKLCFYQQHNAKKNHDTTSNVPSFRRIYPLQRCRARDRHQTAPLFRLRAPGHLSFLCWDRWSGCPHPPASSRSSGGHPAAIPRFSWGGLAGIQTPRTLGLANARARRINFLLRTG